MKVEQWVKKYKMKVFTFNEHLDHLQLTQCLICVLLHVNVHVGISWHQNATYCFIWLLIKFLILIEVYTHLFYSDVYPEVCSAEAETLRLIGGLPLRFTAAPTACGLPSLVREAMKTHTIENTPTVKTGWRYRVNISKSIQHCFAGQKNRDN